MKKEKEARKLLRKGEITDGIDKLNEAAYELKHMGEFEKAISLCEEGSKIAREHHKLFEGSLCNRTLSEIHALLGNRELCLQHIATFREMSIECESRSQEQLSYHVEAWCLQQLYLNDNASTEDIEKAIALTKKSRELVDLYKKCFKDSEPGGELRIRKAQLLILEAQLQNQMSNNTRSLQLLDKANSLLWLKDKSIRFELNRTRLCVAPVHKRVEIAEFLNDDAPEDKKAQSLCELSHQYILANRLEESYKTLAEAYLFYEAQTPVAELEETIKRICILYRLVKYDKIRRNLRSEPKISQFELHEAIGDLYDKYFQTLMQKEKKEYAQFAKDNILMNFQKMLEFKRNDEDVLRSYQAMALVYIDLEDYAKSLELFKKRLDLLLKTNSAEEKIIDTRVSIFGCMCKMKYPDLEASFNDLNEKVSRLDTKRELLETWANYWTDQKNDQNKEKWREAANSIPDVQVVNEDDETDVLFGRLSNEEVIERCKEENELLKVDRLSEHQLSKTNDKGETYLHDAARKADHAYVEHLCKRGCDVNVKDYGGWTPLSEAVAHGKLRNVRVLIRYGADVNSRSTESFVSEESPSSSSEINHSGLTPLMEACTNGFVDIAQLLIDNKAAVGIKDSSGWTAYHHLKHFIGENETTEKLRQFAEYLKTLTFCNKVPPNFNKLCDRTVSNQQEENDSPPDEAEDNMIFEQAASRKRRNSNNSEYLSNSSKRMQQSSKNHRQSISPSILSHSGQKRSVLNSSSPTISIRSAPSVFGGNDDLHIVGKKIPDRQNKKSSTPDSTTSLRPSSTSKYHQKNEKSLDIPIKCRFETTSELNSDIIDSIILPMPRSATISEVKHRVSNSISNRGNSSASHLRVSRVWKTDDADKCLLDDELTLSHLACGGTLALVFKLTAAPAHEVYQTVSKKPIADVTDRLKEFSLKSQLDLTNLFLDSCDILDVTRTLKTCERPQNFSLSLGQCELSADDETNLQAILQECGEFKVQNTISKSGFSRAFEKQIKSLRKLEMLCVDFREESKIWGILKSCPNLEYLNLSGIRFSANPTPIATLGVNSFSHLKKLDLSFNSYCISSQCWREILGTLKSIEDISMNETTTDVQFECDWLPNLCAFSARGSDLSWDSVFGALSVMERIAFVDVRFSTVDPDLPKELQKEKPNALEVLYR